MLSSLSIGSAHIANRFAMAPMTTNYAGPAGEVTQELIDYLEERARGGFGLVFTENMGVHASGRVMPRMLMADSDALVPGLCLLAQALQAHGTRVFAQLSHCGRQSRPEFTGGTLVAPSAIACPINRVVPRALADEEIRALIASFADAAARVAEAGYDGIELHGAHGYLIGEFLSAYANHRDDAWGGSADKRMRFVREIISAIRARTSLPLCVRLSADELVEGGNHIEDSIRIAHVLAADGVDAISVSAGVYESFNALSMVSGDVAGKWLPLSGQMRRELPRSVTVLGVGRIRNVDEAEQALADDLCDVPLFGRAAIADAWIPARATGRKPGPVVACMFCNVCLGRSARPETICPVNPAVGRDAAFAGELAMPTRAKLAIRGGGLPALTAAWVAAARGADVELHCEEAALGGMLAQRAAVPDQAELSVPVAAALWRAEAAGVRRKPLRASVAADRRLVSVEAMEPLSPDTLADQGLSVYRILDGTHVPDPRAFYVVVGDDLASIDTALELAAAGACVRLLSVKGQLGWDAHPGFRALGREGLQRLGVQIGKADESIGPEAIRIRGRLQGVPAPDRPPALIEDAWDAATMTTRVYAAAAWAASV
ncbi:MAG: NADH:flavin oxidoreductase [Bdellovibrionales bacterium]|nr:NADH:flavin oxidoreductase [Ramlibacter sp.]